MELWHLRAEQFFRYMNHTSVEDSRAKVPVVERTHENTMEEEEESTDPLVVDDSCHRHFDEHVSAMPTGTTWRPAVSSRALPHAHRRRNTDLCVPRSAFLEPLGEKRKAFYEQRLLFGLPWLDL